jgi:hypothetical protein
MPLTKQTQLILTIVLLGSNLVMFGANYTYLQGFTKTPNQKPISAQITPRSLTPIGEQGEGIGDFS